MLYNRKCLWLYYTQKSQKLFFCLGQLAPFTGKCLPPQNANVWKEKLIPIAQWTDHNQAPRNLRRRLIGSVVPSAPAHCVDSDGFDIHTDLLPESRGAEDSCKYKI